MTRHYTTRDFFRKMPKPLLGRYFASRGLFAWLKFDELKEGDPVELFDAWLYVPDTTRIAVEADFRDIFDLSDRKGWLAILDEGRWHLRGEPETQRRFVLEMSALPNHYERAMVTFLDHSALWKGAMRFHFADSLSYWRKRKNLPKVAASVDDASIGELASRIKMHFHTTEGRGKNCVVEPYRRGDRDYFFAYPEDHSQHGIEWVDGVFSPRPHNPAFEIVFVYDQADGSLDLNFRGAKPAVLALQSIFAHAILKIPELAPEPKEDHVYDLNPLQNKHFQFTVPVGSGIEKVAVKKMRLSSRMNQRDRVTVEADISKDSEAVYTLLDKIGRSTVLSAYSVTHVELEVTLTPQGDKPLKPQTIKISHPNSCSLKYEEMDDTLRAMLASSGIEAKAAQTQVSAAAE